MNVSENEQVDDTNSGIGLTCSNDADHKDDAVRNNTESVQDNKDENNTTMDKIDLPISDGSHGVFHF